jgi:archaellum component FlaC
MAWGFIDDKEFKTFQRETLDALSRLSQRIDEKASDSEEIAKVAAQHAEAAKDRALQQEAEVSHLVKSLTTYHDQATTALQETHAEKSKLEEALTQLNTRLTQIEQLMSAAAAAKDSIDSSAKDTLDKVEFIRRFIDESVSLPEKLERINELQAEAKKANESITALLQHSASRKDKIDQLHSEILGQDVGGENGEMTHIDGVKDRLETAYSEVSSKLLSMRTDVDSAIRGITQEYEHHMALQGQDFSVLVETSTERVKSIEEQLRGLLPGGLAAGLSAAYEKKKDVEVATLSKLEKTFSRAILGMAVVSLIPFAIDVYLVLWQHKELVQVIKDTPIMIGSILPLYFPILWVAHSANKNGKLSKRLIEEYTHKAVLGNTFSGLSNQIETMPHEGTVRNELRMKLLHNILHVSAENPGKLITDYNKSDHPLMEALENSTKLADSIRKLSKIPGFAAVAKKMTEKNEATLKEHDDKIKEGLKAQDDFAGSESRTAA